MRDVTNANFGLLIAYVIPGFVLTTGLSLHIPVLHQWMTSPTTSLPSIGGLVFTTLYAVLAGLFVSTVRWLVIDSIHAAMGVEARDLNFSELHDRIHGYETIIGNTYRYYQHYANMLIAAPATWLMLVTATGWNSIPFLMLILFQWVYWHASRDTLRRYHNRTSMLLGESVTPARRRPTDRQQ